ncbi:MAG: hypothetical protein FWF90_15650 [Promicromonosporaceae bacterium]|nr:hypothetical protein [Promicromonosporaceae bacterium]
MTPPEVALRDELATLLPGWSLVLGDAPDVVTKTAVIAPVDEDPLDLVGTTSPIYTITAYVWVLTPRLEDYVGGATAGYTALVEARTALASSSWDVGKAEAGVYADTWRGWRITVTTEGTITDDTEETP